MTDFGSPGAGDATSRIEKHVIEDSRQRVERLRNSDQIMNRPLGSIVDLPEEDQIADWQSAVSDPQALLEKIGQRALAAGPLRSELEARRWDKEMREKVK